MLKFTHIIYFALLMFGATAGAQDTGFNLTLRHAEARHVVLEIENHSGADVYWYDYFVNKTHRLSASIFEFPKEVEEPPYIGKMVERSPPRVSSFILLKNHQSYRVEIDMSQNYLLRPEVRYECLAKVDFRYFVSPAQSDSLDRAKDIVLVSNTLNLK